MSDYLAKFYASPQLRKFLSTKLVDNANQLSSEKLQFYLRIIEKQSLHSDPIGAVSLSEYFKLLRLPHFISLFNNAIKEYILGNSKLIQYHLFNYLVAAGETVYANEIACLFDLKDV